MKTEGLVPPQLMLDDRYLAHTKDSDGHRRVETLSEHSELTLRYYERYCDRKRIDEIVEGLIFACGFRGQEIPKVRLMFVHAIYLHDIGKTNPRYQYDVLKNDSFRGQRQRASNSNHALASAYMYVDYMYKLLEEEPTSMVEKCLVAFAYCISKHHGRLGNGSEFSELETWEEEYYKCEVDGRVFEDVRFYMQEQGTVEPIPFYILCRLLYALITGCDYCATQEFMAGSAVELSVITNGGKELARVYDDSERCRSIRQYQRDPSAFSGEPINALRNQIFLEAERNLLAKADSDIYYLEAPTGAGKTNMAVNLALRVLEVDNSINNVFYVFPFNTLVEQTSEYLRPLFGGKMAVVNSITPVLVGGDGQNVDYEVAWLDHISNNYPIVLTSHVNFFNALFGCGRGQCFPLLKICNSVVVLDEIQSYKNSIWREIIGFLQKYARLLHMKIIIMSATLPQLDRLLKNVDAQFTALIESPDRYYSHPLFQGRVRLDFSLLEQHRISLERLKEEVLRFRDKQVLVEFVKKKTAMEFYKLCKDDCNAVLLTGDDSAARRGEVIARIRGGESLVLVATQVIEAGVDIDMEVGFKDISLPDAEEQFLGRINRSCLRPGGGIAYFFDYDDPATVYKGDARLRHSILDPDVRLCLEKKRFAEVYARVFKDLIARTSKPNQKNIANVDKQCVQLNFRVIEDQMRLIGPSFQLFIPYVLGEVDGYQVWQEFKELGSNQAFSYAQRMVEYSRIALRMSYFTFQVFRDKIPEGAEEYGGYYFLDGGERFIDGGVLNREALEKYYGGIFL
ncbi:ATP-dependent RNA helicase SrmB [Peptococcaceae bacterium CEB3]|nr:ATP-dependent RNA helicase SrmB [Peptococcaceae bacterium CEB3]